MEYQYIICHYAEIGLKGKNRKFFEEKLIENIKRVLMPDCFEFVKRISGRIIVKLNKIAVRDPISRSCPRTGLGHIKEITEALQKVFGIAYFSWAVQSKQDIKLIKEKAFEILKEKKFRTFKISCQRSKKDFHLDSHQINEKIGEYILRKFQVPMILDAKRTPRRVDFQLSPKSQMPKINVDLENPDITCFIEVVERYGFLYTEKIKGLGGLPSGTSAKAVVLLSGGIDSPVAAFQTMKRGVRTIFIHFHALPYTSKASIEKVKKIAAILNEYQSLSKLYPVNQKAPVFRPGMKGFDGKIKMPRPLAPWISGVYLIPFADIQKEIFLKTPAKLRVILYRRFMFKIAQEIAEKEKALALVSGESIGQVASQTLENIKIIEQAVHLPVFRPLIGQDKEEIIALAKKIGTFKLSILPHEDCCSRFLPKHPETKAKVQDVKKAESKLDIEKLISNTIAQIKIDPIT